MLFVIFGCLFKYFILGRERLVPFRPQFLEHKKWEYWVWKKQGKKNCEFVLSVYLILFYYFLLMIIRSIGLLFPLYLGQCLKLLVSFLEHRYFFHFFHGFVDQWIEGLHLLLNNYWSSHSYLVLKSELLLFLLVFFSLLLYFLIDF